MELAFEQQGKPNDYCLNTPFHPQKVHSKTFSTPISTNISCKINHLPGSDPAKPPSLTPYLKLAKEHFEFLNQYSPILFPVNSTLLNIHR